MIYPRYNPTLAINYYTEEKSSILYKSKMLSLYALFTISEIGPIGSLISSTCYNYNVPIYLDDISHDHFTFSCIGEQNTWARNHELLSSFTTRCKTWVSTQALKRPGRALALYDHHDAVGCALNNESNGASDVMVETAVLKNSSKPIMRQE